MDVLRESARVASSQRAASHRDARLEASQQERLFDEAVERRHRIYWVSSMALYKTITRALHGFQDHTKTRTG